MVDQTKLYPFTVANESYSDGQLELTLNNFSIPFKPEMAPFHKILSYTDKEITIRLDPRHRETVLNSLAAHINHYLDINDRRKKFREFLLTKILLGEGVEKIVSMTYDGYGDSGNVETCSVDSPAIADFLWDVMYKLHGGFENNEGGRGTVTWDLVSDTIHVIHHDAVITYETSENKL